MQVAHEMPINWSGYRMHVARVKCPMNRWTKKDTNGLSSVHRCYNCNHYIDRTKEILQCAFQRRTQ